MSADSSSPFLSLGHLLPEIQSLARWISSRFDCDGSWPTSAETRIFCYDNDLDYEALVRLNEVFDEIPDGTDVQPRPVGVRTWVLKDSGACARAFEVGEQLVAQAIPDLRKRGVPVERSREDIASLYGLSHDGRELKHLSYLLGRSRIPLLGQKPNWSIRIGMEFLRRPHPTFVDMLLDPRVRSGSASPEPKPGLSIASLFAAQRGDSSRRKARRTHWAFVGSTWADLGDHYRPKVLEALLSQKILPLGMEHWSADHRPSIDRSMEEIAQANLALFILGKRYGSPARPGDARSFTETEYDEATRVRGIDVLAFLSADGVPWDPGKLDPANLSRQEAFRQRVRQERLVRTFSTPDQLRSEVIAAVVDWLRSEE